MAPILLRPLTTHENAIYRCNKDGSYYISYVLRVSTPRPLSREDGLSVARSLYRKCPNLRLRIVEKDGQLHFSEMEEEIIDFKMLESERIYDTFTNLPLNYSANFEEGPLWCIRLMVKSSDEESFMENTSSSEGGSSRFKYISHFVIVYSHAITDGYSCVRIAKCLLGLINDKLRGIESDDSLQIGKMIDVNREKDYQSKISEMFRKDRDLFERRKQAYFSFASETLFEKAYPVQPYLKPQTKTVVHVVNKELTQKFIMKCKQEGVTVHTGFCALVERTAIQMMVNRGFHQESFVISSPQAADNRVYYKDCVDELGVGMGVMYFVHEVNMNESINNFWSAAKKYHYRFKEEHKQMPGLEVDVIEKEAGCTPVVQLPKKGMAKPSKHMSYYSTTNMRDLTSLLSNIGENVQLEFLDRLTTMHRYPCIWMNTFNTFRGEFIHSLQYNSHLMEENVAQAYSNLLFQFFEEVIHK